MYDHAIPLAALRDGLKRAAVSHDALYAFLQRFIQGVVITREENVLLVQKGLNSKMPTGAACHDMLARYRAGGIQFSRTDKAKLRQNLTDAAASLMRRNSVTPSKSS